MSIYKANKEITGIYVGTTQISNAYIGSSQIYGGGSVSVDGVMFTAKQSNSTVGLDKLSTGQTLEYSTDGNSWNSMTTATTIALTNIGDSVYVRGVLSSNNTSSNYTNFKMTGNIKASGNINYLWNYNNPDAALKTSCGRKLFYFCSALKDVTELELPATTLATHCYYQMFGFTQITTAPALPATTLADVCYAWMFGYCSNLTTAPELPATTLKSFCYDSMFSSCSNLNYIKCLATNISATNCTNSWVSGVAASGTFVKNPNMTGWTTGNNGIPTNWTITDA